MIEDFTLTLLAGGLYRHTPAWNKRDHFTQCYKFYLPIRGYARLETSDDSCLLLPGNIYFVPGYRLRRQQCDKMMLAYWIHIGAKSFYLHHRLGTLLKVYQWPLSKVMWMKPTFQRISEMFHDPESKHSRPLLDPPLALVCRFEAILMYLVADLLDQSDEPVTEDAARLIRLKPAVEFMDGNFLRNPSLSEVSAKAGLAPNYFHRIFRRAAGITPFEYMESRRLDRGRRLLFEAKLSIKEIAALSGYENELYFSRVFRRRFGASPSKLQRTSILS